MTSGSGNSKLDTRNSQLASEASCSHCGQVVPSGLVRVGDELQFCCEGCRGVHAILTASGLDGFYRLRDGGGVLRPEERRPAPATDAPEEYDGPAFAAAYVHPLEDGRCELDWHVAGMHCAACVWLLEQLPRILPGVHVARVDFAASRLRLRYDPARLGPARQARCLASLGYRAHPWGDRRAADAVRAERRGWLLRFVVAAASAASCMHLSVTLFAGREAGDMSLAAVRGFGTGALLVAAPALTYAAWPFYRGAITALRLGRASIDLGVLLVVVLGLVLSVVNLVRGEPEIYADAMAMFVAFLLGGRLALVSARERVAGGGALHGLLPEEARRRRVDGSFEPVVPDELQPEDRVLVRRGELLPADGEVVAGEAELDVAVLTGEPRPLHVAAGDQAEAGCRLITGELELRCLAAGAASRMGRLLEAVRSGSWQPTPRSQLVDRLTAWYAPAVAVLAIATWLLWRELDPSRAMNQAMALVLACCPCALGLATPLAYALAVKRAAARGIVLRDGGAVEVLAAPMHVVLDKTGTLTAGRFQVVGWEWLAPLDEHARARIQAAVLSAERRSRHPIALAVTSWLAAREVRSEPIAECEELLGRGLVVRAELGELRIGSASWTGVAGGEAGTSVVGLALDGRPVARIALRDPLAPGADDLVAACRATGATVHLCSGDDPAVCAAVAAELGIDPARVRGGQSPEDKAALVAELVHAGPTVMIGDGVNDRLALEAADVGVGLRGGMAAVMACCQVYLARPGPAAVPELLAGARRTTIGLRRALWASLGYNLVAVVAVVVGFWGPYVCAVAMPASSLLTILYLTRRRGFAAANEPGTVTSRTFTGAAGPVS